MNEVARISGSDAQEATCLHCGLATRSATESFCCAGCEYVYRTIHDLGLTDFYRYRGASSAPVRIVPGSEHFEALDHPDFVKRNLTLLDGEILRGTFYLSGIHCAGCVWLLEGLPRILPGVLTSSVNFGSGKITVVFQPAQVSLSRIASRLDSLGYRIQPVGSDDLRGEEQEDRRMLLRVGIASVCAMNSMVLAVSLWQGFFTGIESEFADYFRWASILISLPAVFYSAIPFYTTAFSAHRMKRFHIDLPISIAIIGAFGVSVFNTVLSRENVYFDTVTTLIFLLLAGRVVQRRALKRARAESRLAWSVLPAFARKVTPSGSVHTPIALLARGDMVEVSGTERIPVDGVVVEGESSVDCSVLTGESIPVSVKGGDPVHAGTLNGESPLLIRVTGIGRETRVGRLLERLEDFSAHRAKIFEFTERVSVIFVVAVLGLAALTLVLWWSTSPYVAIDNMVAVLIVSCPCALGLATPLAFGVAISQAAEQGILVKGTEAIERIVRVEHLYLDKTGTLTEGMPLVSQWKIFDPSLSEDTLRHLSHSLSRIAPAHPVSAAMRRFAGDSRETMPLSETGAIAGKGVLGKGNDGTLWKLGSRKWFDSEGVNLSETIEGFASQGVLRGASPLFLARNGSIVAAFLLSDRLKEGAAEFVNAIREMGIRPFMLSGDAPSVVEEVAGQSGIALPDSRGALYPEEKAAVIGNDMSATCMVGDGVNDCAAMKSADVAIGVHGGIEVSLEVADVFVTDPSLEKLRTVFVGSRRTMRVIHMNLVISLLYNIAGSVAAVCGYVNPLVAAIVMPISSLTVVTTSIMCRTFNKSRDT